MIGFHPKPQASFLVFPKRITSQRETTVVGIKYDQLAAPAVKRPLFKKAAKRPPGIPKRKKQRAQTNGALADETKASTSNKSSPLAPRKISEFKSHVVITAVQRIELNVEAPTEREAARLLKAQAAGTTLNLGLAKVTKKIGKASRKRQR